MYVKPYNEDYPVICLSVHLLRKCALWAAVFLPLHDEKPYQLLAERYEPIAMKESKLARYDNEYERMGICAIFVMTEPLKGWHHAYARQRRTAIDFAYEIDWLLNHHKSPYSLLHIKAVPKIKLITDNLKDKIVLPHGYSHFLR